MNWCLEYNDAPIEEIADAAAEICLRKNINPHLALSVVADILGMAPHWAAAGGAENYAALDLLVNAHNRVNGVMDEVAKP